MRERIMKAILSKFNSIRKRRIDVARSLWYTKKWPSDHGKFIVAQKTHVDAGKENLMRAGNVHIGCPKGIFGHIGIPGVDATLIKVDGHGALYLQEGVCLYAGTRIIVAGQGCVEIDQSKRSSSFLLDCLCRSQSISICCELLSKFLSLTH